MSNSVHPKIRKVISTSDLIKLRIIDVPPRNPIIAIVIPVFFCIGSISALKACYSSNSLLLRPSVMQPNPLTRIFPDPILQDKVDVIHYS